MNLIISITSKIEDLATPYLRIMCLVLKILRKTPQYKKLKNEKIVSLTLRVTDQNGNVITNGLGMTAVLHIR